MALTAGLLIFLTVFTVMILGGGVAVLLMVARKAKNRKNFIDIAIFEIVKGTYQFRMEKGRFLMDPHRGKVLVTCKRGLNPKSVKDKLAYHIGDSDMVPSMMGVGRKFIMVARKNGLSASMEYISKSSEFTEEEKNLLSKINDKYNNNVVHVEDVPASMSLTPITAEQTRFALDVIKDSQKLYFDEDKQTARFLMRSALIIMGVVLVGCVVIFAIMVGQAPDFAASVAANAASSVPNNVMPGIPLPT